jgi:hypothetical protein
MKRPLYAIASSNAPEKKSPDSSEVVVAGHSLGVAGWSQSLILEHWLCSPSVCEPQGSRLQ